MERLVKVLGKIVSKFFFKLPLDCLEMPHGFGIFFDGERLRCVVKYTK